MPGIKEMPSTVARSSKKAQDTWVKAHDSAVEQYGEGRRAHQTAFAALKHTHEKVGDRWEPKERKGPSDPGAKKRGGKTYGGVDYFGNTRDELYDRARDLNIAGRSRMSKEELAEAIGRKQ
ncbi:MAG: cation transport regulator ChaB [Actinobacteria bacterium HGW-Actinobacteria-10]|nr:MAG: cation transport regulator ChaB [Actinobacteria bacterium HGW-Actinobacteria-10]